MLALPLNNPIKSHKLYSCQIYSNQVMPRFSLTYSQRFIIFNYYCLFQITNSKLRQIIIQLANNLQKHKTKHTWGSSPSSVRYRNRQQVHFGKISTPYVIFLFAISYITLIANQPSIMSAQPSLTLQSSFPRDPFSPLKPEMNTAVQMEQLHQPAFWNEQFPTYNFEREIAVTDNSLVWLGTHKNRCEKVALKITHKFQTESSEKMHQNKENQFVSKHHLNCMVEVQLQNNSRKQVLTSDQFRLMVMKYYRWDLEQIQATFTSNKNKRYTQQHFLFVIYVFRALLDAVSELHSYGYVHRDLKPDNILIDQQFKLVLGDFGLVTKQNDVDVSSSGTIQFLPPERLSKRRRQNPIKMAVDIWSLGIIMYQLFTGENPFNGQTQEEILESICQGYIKVKQIPQQAMSLICQMLQVSIDKRPTLEQIRNHPFLQREVGESFIKDIISTLL